MLRKALKRMLAHQLGISSRVGTSVLDAKAEALIFRHSTSKIELCKATHHHHHHWQK